MFFSSSDLGTEHNPRATFLWITDDPALNRQTRNRMLAASDLLGPKHLTEINDGFLDQALVPGQVYFLNTQKLSKTSRLVQNTNLRQLTFWDVLANTTTSENSTLYLILDEAHRGMRRAPDRTTIVQRLIHGEPGSSPPIPVVWGISATIERFTKAMGETLNRAARSHNERAATRDGTGEDLPVFEGHIYSDSDGNFPAKLNDWESRVIATETARPSFVAWYRNPQRATPNSLRIAYQDESEHWKSMQVDFIIISKRQDGTLAASIVDPHGDHLSDAKAKLRALAEFAEQFRDQFLRIESIAEVNGELQSVDLRDSRIRDAVRAFEGGGVSPLYTSEYSNPYL